MSLSRDHEDSGHDQSDGQQQQKQQACAETRRQKRAAAPPTGGGIRRLPIRRLRLAPKLRRNRVRRLLVQGGVWVGEPVPAAVAEDAVVWVVGAAVWTDHLSCTVYINKGTPDASAGGRIDSFESLRRRVGVWYSRYTACSTGRVPSCAASSLNDAFTCFYVPSLIIWRHIDRARQNDAGHLRLH